ncbi:MAG TPA: sulfatase [Methylomirabilota bacterium]
MDGPASRAAAGLPLMGLWLGLAWGLLEGAGVTALGLVPGALSWRNANTTALLWFAPLYYGVLFGLLGLVLAGAARLAPRIRWDSLLFGVAVFAAVYLAGNVHPQLLTPLAAAVLGAGAAAAAVRAYRKRSAGWRSAMRRSLPWLVVVIGLIAAMERVVPVAAEAVRTARLPEPPEGAPNVLLLVMDTQRADHLSGYGYARPTTPALDRLAAEGALFERAYAPSSWTLPSHATMFLGRPLHEHRAGLMRRPWLDDRFPTLAETLRDRGWATGGFTANTYWTGRQTGLDRGFLHYEDMYGNLGDAMARTGLGRLLAYDVLPRFGRIDVPGRKWAEEVNADFLDWVGGVNDRPFFAFLNYFDVHGPYLPPAPYAGRFSAVPERTGSDEIEIGALTGDIVLPSAEELARMVDRYDESLLYLDAAIGRLMAALRARGLLDETIVIVTSDHGESWGEHGLMYHGHSLYMHQLHVPLLLRYPAALAPGTRSDRHVGLERLPATVLELAGLDRSAFGGPTFFEEGPPVLAEVGRRSQSGASWPSSRGWLASLIADTLQYIRHESDGDELYDLRADPDQSRDLARQEPAAAAAFGHRLDELLPAGGLDPLPPPWARLFGQ